jgi:hypothetical protein
LRRGIRPGQRHRPRLKTAKPKYKGNDYDTDRINRLAKAAIGLLHHSSYGRRVKAEVPSDLGHVRFPGPGRFGRPRSAAQAERGQHGRVAAEQGGQGRIVQAMPLLVRGQDRGQEVGIPGYAGGQVFERGAVRVSGTMLPSARNDLN